jgi:hypothetical protein
MKSITKTVTRVLCLLSLLEASQGTQLLRSSIGNATTSESRRLQDNPVPLSEGWLNQLIKLLLPLINEAIQNNVPDPLDLDLAGELTLGSIDLGCDDPVTAGFTYAVGGTSSRYIAEDLVRLVSYDQDFSLPKALRVCRIFSLKHSKWFPAPTISLATAIGIKIGMPPSTWRFPPLQHCRWMTSVQLLRPKGVG